MLLRQVVWKNEFIITQKIYIINPFVDIADLGKLVVENNKLSDKIEIIKSKIEDINLPEKVDVIISEVTNFSLFYSFFFILNIFSFLFSFR